MDKKDFRLKKNTMYARILNLIGNLFFCYCVVIALGLIIFSSVTIECVVVGRSMAPGLNADLRAQNDIVYVNKYMTDYAYGDIVVIEISEKDPIIKRVIGVAGDTIDIVNLQEDGYKLEINGKLIEEDYLLIDYSQEEKLQNGMESTYVKFHLDLRAKFPECFNAGGKFVVPEGQVFVLGDNRHDSQDSTHYGAFDLSSVMGKVERVRRSSENEFNFYYEYIRDGKFFETLYNCF